MKEEYKRVLQSLDIRLYEKDKQYGLSYLDKDCTLDWLFKTRLLGEVTELQKALLTGVKGCIIDEALDVAICALLIASKAIESGME